MDSKPTKQVNSFEFTLAAVRQFLDGDGTLLELALRHQLSSPKLLGKWIRIYREQGEEGLRSKAKGRPKAASGAEPGEPTEVEQLRRENQRLQAENAYLKKFGP
ncbi:transposase-like protein [Paeniglutamicibacter psychrophenolicus]|nr:transposase [Paeniglutamicibacter psychrophenolicus]MDQ0095937.1 transposase-like protein [Paeniglutamicibacter psychrophenolicus]